MDNSIRAALLRTLDAVVRRRWLLLIPILFFIPASIGLAYLRGGSYASRSLVMLQETLTSNPLGHEGSEPSADRMAQTLKSVRALVASDFVLAPVVTEMSPTPLNPKEQAAQVRDLAQRVSVNLLGNDFLEFQLTGRSPIGLGATLQSTMAHLIGALSTPPGERASQFALHALEDQLAAAKRSLTQPEAASGVGAADSKTLANSPEPQATQARKEGLAGEIRSLAARIDAAKAKAAEGTEGGWTQIINAPGRMIVVDPPRDPDAATKSRLVFALMGMFGGVLLGVALVIVAEIFDTTLRQEDQLVALAGAPCLCSLPPLSAPGGMPLTLLGASYGSIHRLPARDDGPRLPPAG